MLGIRLEFTLEQFFADGGIVSFADRMAAVLGIHAADIKVVSVYEGSTIVEFQIVQRDSEEVDPLDMLSLDEIDQAYREFVNTQESFMGSKILDATISGSPMISPFEEKRHRSGHYENDEFREFVK